ncbi:sugar transferase [Lutibacter sp.]|uniref:sugar transferase n=1 Tax=Lutibacter sp. TaxID=1925666 RepID=UPI002734E3B6|nr:sugar transferase [Lutibacter sp.]MDP3313047.1 sugar transferase [Lutibacter sp.]
MYRKFFKRLIDVIFSLIGLLLVSPVLLLATILLIIANNGKPFFFQLRSGKNGIFFKIVKFRTMTNSKNLKENLLPDNERMTKIGSFLRKTSLDELPQLFNVLKGEMSLIGPRPLLPEYLPLYSAKQNKRHLVRAGITGWAQVNGRNAISWKDKFKLDVYYVENLSLKFDLKILFLTIRKVVKKDGITSNIYGSMEKFKGNN